jgi:ABC-type transport system involved in cytochrome c biogenesis permease subunit
MGWIDFPIVALFTTFFLLAGTILAFIPVTILPKKIYSDFLIIIGILIQAIFICILWIILNRPPLRTTGETRLWFSFFLSLIGYITYKRWNYSLILLIGNLMALLFILTNYLHPENYDKTLMPALLSLWFAPHVIVYMLGYAFLGLSAIVALVGLYQVYFDEFNKKNLAFADTLVCLGYSCITLGLLFGALWAQEVWGNYWMWDPKETWALLTWMSYLIYIHLRKHKLNNTKTVLWTLFLAFVVLLIAWFGINYLPSAQNSVHVYSN